MNKGDIVLIPFPFTDLSGNKNRPAVILIDSEDDVTVCFITTQLKWQSAEFDIAIQPSELNGLKKPSLIRLNKLTTLDKELIIGRLGVLDNHYSDLLNENLVRLLKLEIN
jgi:mRNA interferase MazF